MKDPKMNINSFLISGFVSLPFLTLGPVNIIRSYVHSKPIGAQRLVDLIYADIALLDLVSIQTLNIFRTTTICAVHLRFTCLHAGGTRHIFV